LAAQGVRKRGRRKKRKGSPRAFLVTPVKPTKRGGKRERGVFFIHNKRRDGGGRGKRKDACFPISIFLAVREKRVLHLGR